MSKKSKRKRKSHPAQTQQNSGDKSMQNNGVKIHGSIEVHPSQDYKTSHDAERKEDTSQKSKEYSLARWSLKVAVAALIISTLYFVATALIVWQSKESADAAKSAADTAARALRDSQKSFEIENRPYVIVDGTAYFLTRDGKAITSLADINYKNIGKTPAQDVFVLAHYSTLRFHGREHTQELLTSSIIKAFQVIVDDEAKIPQADAAGELNKTDIAPDAPSSLITRELKGEDVLSEKDARLDLLSGNVMPVYVGRIYYNGFEKTRSYSTDFCFFFFGPDPKLWHFCPTHNAIK